MIYCYIKDWHIIRRDKKQVTIDCDNVIQADYEEKDMVIYEDWIIKKYEDSTQYKIDYNIPLLEIEIEKLKRQNKLLEEQSNRVLTAFEKLQLTDQLLLTTNRQW